jgi:carboxyl-terminal processing protease
MDATACKQIAEEIRRLEAEQVSGYILDLRANGGGQLQQARCIAGLFLGDRPIVGTKSLASQKIDWLRALHPNAGPELPAIWHFPGFVFDVPSKAEQLTQSPVVVLIDAYSASASEIVAGAIQDHGRGWLVGERSFGKGTVQTLLTNQIPGAQVYIGRTTSRFYLPSGRTNQLVGVLPDFEVPFQAAASSLERFAAREADLYPHALISENSVWAQPRKEQVTRIQNCMASQSSLEGSDNQLLVAQQVLSCADLPERVTGSPL